MSIPEKFVPNQRLDGFPGGTMNWATDNIERLLAAGMPPAEAVARLSGAPLALSVLVKNETSGHVPPGGVLTSGGPVANAAQEPSQRLRPKLKGLAPAADKLVLISQSGIAPGGAGPCNYQGLCTAWVDVSDVDHTFAKITAGESLQLESTADSTNLKMEWFEHQGEAPPGGGGEDPRLGRQLALVNIGGGGGGGEGASGTFLVVLSSNLPASNSVTSPTHDISGTVYSFSWDEVSSSVQVELVGTPGLDVLNPFPSELPAQVGGTTAVYTAAKVSNEPMPHGTYCITGIDVMRLLASKGTFGPLKVLAAGEGVTDVENIEWLGHECVEE